MIPLLLVYKCQIIGKFPNISHALGTFYLLFIFLDHLEVLFLLIHSLIKKKLLMSCICSKANSSRWFFVNSEFCLIYTRVNLTAAQTSLRSGICGWVVPAVPKVLSQLLLEKGTHPKPLWNQSSTSQWCFPRMDLGSSPLQVSPLWEWGADPTLSSGAGINPCHTQSCCPGSAKTPKSPIFCLSHISCSRSFHPLTYFAVQRNKHKERGKSAYKIQR